MVSFSEICEKLNQLVGKELKNQSDEDCPESRSVSCKHGFIYVQEDGLFDISPSPEVDISANLKDVTSFVIWGDRINIRIGAVTVVFGIPKDGWEVDNE